MITATSAEAREIESLLRLATMELKDITTMRAVLENGGRWSAQGVIRWLRNR